MSDPFLKIVWEVVFSQDYELHFWSQSSVLEFETFRFHHIIVEVRLLARDVEIGLLTCELHLLDEEDRELGVTIVT